MIKSDLCGHMTCTEFNKKHPDWQFDIETADIYDGYPEVCVYYMDPKGVINFNVVGPNIEIVNFIADEIIQKLNGINTDYLSYFHQQNINAYENIKEES